MANRLAHLPQQRLRAFAVELDVEEQLEDVDVHFRGQGRQRMLAEFVEGGLWVPRRPPTFSHSAHTQQVADALTHPPLCFQRTSMILGRHRGDLFTPPLAGLALLLTSRS